jgi:hypothetical protein
VAKLITLEEFKVSLGLTAKADSGKDDLMNAAVEAGSGAVQDALNFDVLQTAYDETYDGTGLPYIWLRQVPVISSVPVTVQENGLSLVSAFGYSAAADVVVDPVRGQIMRQNGSNVSVGVSPNWPARWSEGFQNVRVTYTAGYAVVPEQFKMVTKYLAARFFKEFDEKKVGVSRRTTGAHSVDFISELPDVYQQILLANRRTYFAR